MTAQLKDFPLGAVVSVLFNNDFLEGMTIVALQYYNDEPCVVCLASRLAPYLQGMEGLISAYWRGNNSVVFTDDAYSYTSYIWMYATTPAKMHKRFPEQKCAKCGGAAPHTEGKDGIFVCAMCEATDILTS